MTSRARWARAAVALGLATLLVLFAHFNWPADGLAVGPICPFKTMTGLPCPLCGGTRAAHALLQGDFSRTLYLNPLAIPAVSVGVFGILILLYEAATGRWVAHWPAVWALWPRVFPSVLGALALWWGLHLYLALHTPKPELLELRNPIARAAFATFGRSSATPAH